MRLIPPRGYVFAKEIDPIPPAAPETGFHTDTVSDKELDKHNPIRFEVVAVGLPRLNDNGVELPMDVKVGDVIVLQERNSVVRRNLNDTAFETGVRYVDGVRLITVGDNVTRVAPEE